MKYWLLLLAWATCLAYAAPLADSSALAIEDGTASPGAVASLGDSWVGGASDKSYDTVVQAAVEASKRSYTEKPARNVAQRGVMGNTTASGMNASSPAINGDIAIGDVGTEQKPEKSLQILLFEQYGRHSWFMYQGPYGFAVNPCSGDLFTTVVVKYGEGRDVDFNNPPYVSAGAKWDVNIEGDPNCRYESRADDAGHIICDGGLDLPFGKDVRNNEKGTIHCWKGAGRNTVHWWFHRAWVLEY